MGEGPKSDDAIAWNQHSGRSEEQRPEEESLAKEILRQRRIWVGRNQSVAECKAVSP